jgi:hypothetical protein
MNRQHFSFVSLHIYKYVYIHCIRNIFIFLILFTVQTLQWCQPLNSVSPSTLRHRQAGLFSQINSFQSKELPLFVLQNPGEEDRNLLPLYKQITVGKQWITGRTNDDWWYDDSTQCWLFWQKEIYKSIRWKWCQSIPTLRHDVITRCMYEVLV